MSDAQGEEREHRPGTIDLGAGHWLRFFGWAPDRALNPQYADLPDVERYGATIGHPKQGGAPGEVCESGIVFHGPVQDVIEARAAAGGRPSAQWTVESWSPLTLSPSLLCRQCSDHGFVRAGKWVPAG